MRKKEEKVDAQTSQSGVLKALLLKDKSSLIAIEKQCYWKLKVMLLQSRRIDLLWKVFWPFRMNGTRKVRKWRAKVEEGTKKKEAKWKEQTAELYRQCWNVEMKRWWVEYRMKANWTVKTGKWAAEEARWGSLGKARGGKRATNRAENWCNVACHSFSKTCFCASQQVARTRQHQSFWLWHRFLPWF